MPESWSMHAVRLEDGLLHYVGALRGIEFRRLEQSALPVVVRLVADGDPAATHWAWWRAGRDVPEMIYPRRVLFNACFPYGPQIEQERGRGQIVRLAVEEAPDA